MSVKNSERPQNTPGGGIWRGHRGSLGLTQKNFFSKKMPVLEEKVGWVDFLREKNYRKSTIQLTDI